MTNALRLLAVSLTFSVVATACSATEPPSATDAGATDAGATDASTTDASTTDASTADASTADAGACGEAPAGRLCVRGALNGGGTAEELTVGGAVRFELYPKGCFSSSCSVVREASCAAGAPAGGEVILTGAFCIARTTTPAGCTPDCSGGGVARCERSLDAGTYKAKLDALTLAFTVPSSLPPGGDCVGSQF